LHHSTKVYTISEIVEAKVSNKKKERKKKRSTYTSPIEIKKRKYRVYHAHKREGGLFSEKREESAYAG